MRKDKLQLALVGVLIVIALWYLYPTFNFYTMPADKLIELEMQDPDRFEDLKGRAMKLGLDLQGGIHLVMEVDFTGLSEDAKSDAVDRAIEVIRNRIDQFGVSEPVIHKEGENRIVIELPGVQDIERAKKLIGQTARLEFKLVREPEDLSNILNKIDAALAGTAAEDTSEAAVTAAADTAKVEQEGLFEEEEAKEAHPFTSLLVGFRRDDIAVPVKRINKVKLILNNPRVKEVIPKDSEFVLGKPEGTDPNAVYPLYYVRSNYEATGDIIEDANVSTGRSFENQGQPIVVFRTTDEGTTIFSRVTGANVGKRLAIVLDGRAYSAPRIDSKITGSGEITGSATLEEARDLVIVLRAGALPANVITIEDRTIGPSLGKDSVEKGKTAIIIGLIIVAIFMIVYYRLAGLVADFALALNIIFILSVLSGLHATLTLPGIAGIVLTVGMAVDANVLIFQRIREELRSGKTVRAAIDTGYSRAFSAILDSNVTTLMVALVLGQFGTGPIKGFALTLSIGIVSSMFTALFVTRIIFNYYTGIRNVKSLSIGSADAFRDSNFGFIKRRRLGFLTSVVVAAVGIISMGLHGGLNMGIDFAGGTLLELHFDPPVSVQAVRDALGNVGVNGQSMDLGKSEIKEFGNENDVLIRTQDFGEELDVGAAIKTKLKADFRGSIQDEIDWLRREEKVGPKIGGELGRDAVKAIFLSLALIIVYIWYRFKDIRFGIAAVVALFHDVLITLGIFSIYGGEISLAVVAALLAIVGYSLNDTIVIFDRIREDFGVYRRERYDEIVNRGINESLSRTLITSLTTLSVVLVLLFLGGQVTRGFAFALTVGVIVGTYSSSFVASPILVEWQNRQDKKRMKVRSAAVARTR